MIRSLTLLGIAVVVITGSIAMVTNPGSADQSAGTNSAPTLRTVVPATTSRPSETPTPDPQAARSNCDEIRGTDYRSPEERQWYLANCVTR